MSDMTRHRSLKEIKGREIGCIETPLKSGKGAEMSTNEQDEHRSEQTSADEDKVGETIHPVV